MLFQINLLFFNEFNLLLVGFYFVRSHWNFISMAQWDPYQIINPVVMTNFNWDVVVLVWPNCYLSGTDHGIAIAELYLLPCLERGLLSQSDRHVVHNHFIWRAHRTVQWRWWCWRWCCGRQRRWRGCWRCGRQRWWRGCWRSRCWRRWQGVEWEGVADGGWISLDCHV